MWFHDSFKVQFLFQLQERGINMLFVLGGNGTHAGANAIHEEVFGLWPLILLFAFSATKKVIY